MKATATPALDTPALSAMRPRPTPVLAEDFRADEVRRPSADRVALSQPLADGPPAGGGDLLARLEGIVAARGLARLASRLEDLAEFVALDLVAFEGELAQMPRRTELVGRGASHLLDLGGKRLRPLCLSLAARVGMPAIDQRVLDLAVAVELVHSATLLHDDVVDGGDARRGSATSRAIYGNAASIFAGDWLLIEALRRVENSAVSGLLNELFSVIEQMIFAESLQLENRGRLSLDRAAYFQVAEGKTATVFRWAMLAGARAAGVEPATERALATFGEHLGVSFQAVDDLLDLTGDAEVTGKALFTDLVEGKMTLPLILALERAPELRPTLEAIVALPDGADVPPGLVDHVSTTVRASGAAAECLAIARGRSERAVAALADVPDGRARRALVTMAEAIVDRDV